MRETASDVGQRLRDSMSTNYDLIATTAFGLEAVLRRSLAWRRHRGTDPLVPSSGRPRHDPPVVVGDGGVGAGEPSVLEGGSQFPEDDGEVGNVLREAGAARAVGIGRRDGCVRRGGGRHAREHSRRLCRGLAAASGARSS